jgi:hypothetical protein
VTSCLCRFFATAARDQQVKFWAMVNGQPQTKPWLTLPTFPSAVTAVAVAPTNAIAGAAVGAGEASNGCRYMVAVGLEDGQIQVWGVCLPPGSEAEAVEVGTAVQLWCSPIWHQHAAAVKRICWMPRQAAGDPGRRAFASCGEDHSVRVFTLG